MFHQRSRVICIIIECTRFLKDRKISCLAQISSCSSNQPQRIIVESASDIHVASLGERLILVVSASVRKLRGCNIQDTLAGAFRDQMDKAEQILTGIAESHPASQSALVVACTAAHVKCNHALILVPYIHHTVQSDIFGLNRISGQKRCPVIFQFLKCVHYLFRCLVSGKQSVSRFFIDDVRCTELFILWILTISQDKDQRYRIAGS